MSHPVEDLQRAHKAAGYPFFSAEGETFWREVSDEGRGMPGPPLLLSLDGARVFTRHVVHVRGDAPGRVRGHWYYVEASRDLPDPYEVVKLLGTR